MDIAEFISNVGFPVAMCCYLIYSQTQMQKNHKEEMGLMSKAIEGNTKAIENNTLTIERLERAVSEWQKKE